MKSVAKIIYNPTTHLSSSDRWAILACDDEISKYYRHLYTKQYPYLNGNLHGKLTRPVWGAHISWIRNEKLFNNNLWGLYNNKIIEFDYDAGVKDNGEYFWLNVRCDFILDLREKYGLSRHPKFGLHLTVGRISNN